MFGELPKLFDRNFAIGFFLPVAIFITISGSIVNSYMFGSVVIDFFKNDLLIGATIGSLLSWVGGIVLLAVNRELYRFIEGYGAFNPLKLFMWFEMRRYTKTVEDLKKLDDKYIACLKSGEEFPLKSSKKRDVLTRQLADNFPPKKEYLLPTPFGNALRSFETFPQVMYGIDAIPGWERLLAVMPKDYIELVDGAKAQVDFWVNLGLVFILLQIEYVSLVIITGGQLNWWIVTLWIFLGTIVPLRATSSAKGWGAYVKSSFDVFIPKLRESLGIEKPKNREEEYAQWESFSQAIIYRLPEQMPELKIADTEIKNKK